MSAKHEAIKRQVMIDWTAFKRGTLWPNSQVTVKKSGRTFKAGLGKGTADIVGIECYPESRRRGQWVSIEVKTHGDWIKPDQIKNMNTVNNNNGRYYLALELPNCTIEKPLYMLRIVKNEKDLGLIRKEWNKVWKS